MHAAAPRSSPLALRYACRALQKCRPRDPDRVCPPCEALDKGGWGPGRDRSFPTDTTRSGPSLPALNSQRARERQSLRLRDLTLPSRVDRDVEPCAR